MAAADSAIYKDSLFIYAASYVEAYIWAPPGQLLDLRGGGEGRRRVQ